MLHMRSLGRADPAILIHLKCRPVGLRRGRGWCRTSMQSLIVEAGRRRLALTSKRGIWRLLLLQLRLDTLLLLRLIHDGIALRGRVQALRHRLPLGAGW